MVEAFVWGAIGASALLVGALVAYMSNPSKRLIAVIMALGAGLLIGSVSFELIDDAVQTTHVTRVGLFTLIGAIAFTVGNWRLSRRGGAKRKSSSGHQSEGNGLAIVLGSILDGIPESFVLGLTVLEGGVSAALLAGVILSNLPEGMSSSAGLKIAGWPARRVMTMWGVVIAASAVSAAFGYAVLDPSGGYDGSDVEAFAAGALLAMVADTMLPEAFDEEGVFTGALVAIGFAISIVLSGL